MLKNVGIGLVYRHVADYSSKTQNEVQYDLSGEARYTMEMRGVCLHITSFSRDKNDLSDNFNFCLCHGTVFVEQYFIGSYVIVICSNML